jgi:anthranilate phosphoribosyltransferase
MKAHLAKVVGGAHLSEEEAAAAMGIIMDGAATPAQIGALLAALALRGESEDEVVGFARCMRARAEPITCADAVDTCGTGGDGAATFNISTLASLVVAACGLRVAKHGNRSASGRYGSADLLEALGVRVDAPPATVQQSLDELGWAFLFAPGFHSATRHATGPRRELGLRTAFNLLGPLTNPARPVAQVVGVPRPALVEFVARCLRRLGVRRAWVAHGTAPGALALDELSACGRSQVAAFDVDQDGPEAPLRCFEVHPEQAGLASAAPEALRAESLAECVDIATDVLSGAPGPRRDAVVLNAAAALVAAGQTADLHAAARQAERALTTGAAQHVLVRAREVSQR